MHSSTYLSAYEKLKPVLTEHANVLKDLWTMYKLRLSQERGIYKYKRKKYYSILIEKHPEYKKKISNYRDFERYPNKEWESMDINILQIIEPVLTPQEIDIYIKDLLYKKSIYDPSIDFLLTKIIKNYKKYNLSYLTKLICLYDRPEALQKLICSGIIDNILNDIALYKIAFKKEHFKIIDMLDQHHDKFDKNEKIGRRKRKYIFEEENNLNILDIDIKSLM